MYLLKYLFIFFILTVIIACKKEKPPATASCVTSGSIPQEILNAGFENWDTTNNVPQNWSTTNGEINQSTDRYSGSYAAVIWTWYNRLSELLVNGKLPPFTPFTDEIHKAGTPISVKPAYLKGVYKYTDVVSGDFAVAIVLLKKYDTIQNKIDTVGYGIKFLRPINTYTPFQVCITDMQPSVMPDSIVIAFSSSSNFVKPQNDWIYCFGNVGGNAGECSYLYVDALSLK